MSKPAENKPAEGGSAPNPADIKPPEPKADGKPGDPVNPPAPKSDEKPAGEVKPDDKPKEDLTDVTEKIVPEKYELKVPDGSPLDAKRVERLSEYAKKKGLSNDEAQALIQSEHESLNEFVVNQKKTITENSERWLKEAQADKEIGGDKFEEVAEVAHRAVEVYFKDSAFKDFLQKTGVGNHPSFIKGFYEIGKLLKNDKIIAPNSAPPERPPITKRLYDHPSSQQT